MDEVDFAGKSAGKEVARDARQNGEVDLPASGTFKIGGDIETAALRDSPFAVQWDFAGLGAT